MPFLWLPPRSPDARLVVAAAQVWSRSTGVCPTCCPAGPLLSILCACLPFLDHGQNYAHTQVRSLNGFRARVMRV